MTKKITRSEFTGLPIGQDDETAIMALVSQRQVLEQQAGKLNAAINAISVRLAKEAGWNTPAAELRIERGPDGGLVLMRQEIVPPEAKPPTP